MNSSNSSAPPKLGGGSSLWDAPPNARSESLIDLVLVAPEAREAADVIQQAQEKTRQRAQAYRTPVTEKTLRRKIR